MSTARQVQALQNMLCRQALHGSRHHLKLRLLRQSKVLAGKLQPKLKSAISPTSSRKAGWHPRFYWKDCSSAA
jgi:hypothetical protein